MFGLHQKLGKLFSSFPLLLIYCINLLLFEHFEVLYSLPYLLLLMLFFVPPFAQRKAYFLTFQFIFEDFSLEFV